MQERHPCMGKDYTNRIPITDMGNVGRKPRVTEEELLNTIHELTETNANPVATTQEIVEQVPLKTPSVYDRLQTLYDQGKVHKKKVGAKGVVWWPTEE